MKALSSRTLAIIGLVLNISIVVIPAAFLFTLPFSIIFGIFSLMQARKEKTSFAWGIIAIILPIIVIATNSYLSNIQRENFMKKAYENNPYYNYQNGQVVPKSPQN
jgi:hypothetical protein